MCHKCREKERSHPGGGSRFPSAGRGIPLLYPGHSLSVSCPATRFPVCCSSNQSKWECRSVKHSRVIGF
uniref:Uncharacterized protein n=1 Tax=Anguilla anguilla TaxID=7936 RepID=A0A0E9XPJ3_ANGAN